MYKIVLYDANTPPVYTNLINYYTDNLDDFQKRWFQLETDEDLKERFLISRAGKYVCAIPYIADETKEYDIVQADEDCICLCEKDIDLKKFDVVVSNGYGFITKYYSKEIHLSYQYICFKGKIVKVGKFKAKGVCQDDLFKLGYTEPNVFGNKVVELKNIDNKPLKSNDKSDYDDILAELIAFKELNVFDSFEDAENDWTYNLVSGNELDILFQDFLGDAG